MAQPAFVFDADRCTGCEACRVACGIENAEGRDTGWRQVFTLNPDRHPALPTRHLSLACNHCANPACLLACPAAAFRQDPGTALVSLDSERCVGCRYCSWVCPYDAPRFDVGAGVMRKCTFCEARVAAGRAPACAEACPTAALSVAPRETGAGEPIGPGLPALGLAPALALRSSRRQGPPGGIVAGPPDEPPRQPAPPRKIRLRAEWGLLLFTLALPTLVAWLGAGLIRPERRPSIAAFLTVGVLALGVSLFHLGRPLRAWRAALNWPSSWLSREAVLASAFIATGAVSLASPLAGPVQVASGWLALGLGAATIVTVDAVYRAIPRASSSRVPLGLHSAEAWLTGALLLGLGADLPLLWVLAAEGKVLLLGVRWLARPATPRHLQLPGQVLALRAAILLLAVPWAAISLPWPWPVLIALPGEAIDRAGFYVDLEPMSPAWDMHAKAPGLAIQEQPLAPPGRPARA
jgi:Fe-S-cluster-containing dehydrogenase component